MCGGNGSGRPGGGARLDRVALGAVLVEPRVDEGHVDGAARVARAEVEGARRPQQGDARRRVVRVQRRVRQERLDPLRQDERVVLVLLLLALARAPLVRLRGGRGIGPQAQHVRRLQRTGSLKAEATSGPPARGARGLPGGRPPQHTHLVERDRVQQRVVVEGRQVRVLALDVHHRREVVRRHRHLRGARGCGGRGESRRSAAAAAARRAERAKSPRRHGSRRRGACSCRRLASLH